MQQNKLERKGERTKGETKKIKGKKKRERKETQEKLLILLTHSEVERPKTQSLMHPSA